MFAFRRIRGVDLEGFRRRRRPAEVAVEPSVLSPGVVFHGSAARRPELQRFCEHLDRIRTDGTSPLFVGTE